MKRARTLPSLLVALVLGGAVVVAPSVMAAAPSAPAAPVVSGERDALAVSWSAPADGGSAITSYTAIAYGSSGGSDAVSACLTSSPTALTCLIDNLVSGTTYYVAVKATNADGSGAESPRTSATAGSVPSAPRTVTSSRTRSLLAVSWSAPTDDGGSSITSYSASAYSSTAASATPVASCTTSGLDCSITGLESSTTYYVSVAASNAVGQGTHSSRQASYPADLPSAPQNLKALAGNGFAKMTWSPPASTGNSRITRYEIRAWSALTDGSLVATCSPETLASLSCNLGPLPNGSTYYVDAVATNALGAGPASSPRVSVFTATQPMTPSNVTATRVGSGVRVAWNVPASDGGYSIDSYVASAYSALTGGKALGTCSSTGLECMISGLGGAPVFVAVTARTKAGTSAESTPRIRVRLISSAEIPIAVAGSARPQGIVVTWGPPLNDGGRPVVSYRARALTPDGIEAGACTYEVVRNPRQAGAGRNARIGCTITALTPGTRYVLEVVALTEFGSSPAATAMVKVVQGKPSAPRSVTGIPGDARLTLVWGVPASDGGSPVTSYRAQAWSRVSGGKLVGECTVVGDAEASVRTCAVTGLANFEPVWVQVQAANTRGFGSTDARVSFEPKPAVPSPPERVHITPGANGLSVTWTEPSSNGGYPIFRYIARAFDSATGGTQLGQCTSVVSRTAARTAGPRTECSISGLLPEAFVYVEVLAENTVGQSSATARVAGPATLVP